MIQKPCAKQSNIDDPIGQKSKSASHVICKENMRLNEVKQGEGGAKMILGKIKAPSSESLVVININVAPICGQ